MAAGRIQTTKNYGLFVWGNDNRPLDLTKHKALVASMREYGFLRSFPISVFRNAKEQLEVKDGQHRLAVAEMLGLPVHWVEETVDFDVAKVNNAAKGWQLSDYAQKYASQGNRGYQETLDFATEHHLPIGAAFALMAGTTTFGNVQADFIAGTFRVKDKKWADLVARIYNPIVAMKKELKGLRFIEACMAVCRVDGFDPDRLIAGAKMWPEHLIAFGTRDGYLQMLQDIYNYKRQQRNLVALKLLAETAMRNRSAATQKKGRGGKAADETASKTRKSA